MLPFDKCCLGYSVNCKHRCNAPWTVEKWVLQSVKAGDLEDCACLEDICQWHIH